MNLKNLLYPVFGLTVAFAGCGDEAENSQMLRTEKDQLDFDSAITAPHTDWRQFQAEDDRQDSIRFSKTYYVDRIKACPSRKGAYDVRCHKAGDTVSTATKVFHFAFENDDNSPFDPGQKHTLTMAYYDDAARLILTKNKAMNYETADMILEERPTKENIEALEEGDGDWDDAPAVFSKNSLTLYGLMQKGNAIEQKSNHPGFPGPLLMLTKFTQR